MDMTDYFSRTVDQHEVVANAGYGDAAPFKADWASEHKMPLGFALGADNRDLVKIDLKQEKEKLSPEAQEVMALSPFIAIGTQKQGAPTQLDKILKSEFLTPDMKQSLFVSLVDQVYNADNQSSDVNEVRRQLRAAFNIRGISPVPDGAISASQLAAVRRRAYGEYRYATPEYERKLVAAGYVADGEPGFYRHGDKRFYQPVLHAWVLPLDERLRDRTKKKISPVMTEGEMLFRGDEIGYGAGGIGREEYWKSGWNGAEQAKFKHQQMVNTQVLWQMMKSELSPEQLEIYKENGFSRDLVQEYFDRYIQNEKLYGVETEDLEQAGFDMDALRKHDWTDDWTRNLVSAVPFGWVGDLVNAYDRSQEIKRYYNGEMNDFEKTVFETNAIRMSLLDDFGYTTSNQVWSSLFSSAGFIGEIALTGGLTSLARASLTGGVKSIPAIFGKETVKHAYRRNFVAALRPATGNVFKRFGTELGRAAIEEGVRNTTFYAPKIFADSVADQNRLAAQLSQFEDGTLGVTFTRPDYAKMGDLLMKNWLENYVELFSERLGDFLPTNVIGRTAAKFLPNLAPETRMALGRSFFGWAANQLPGVALKSFAQGVQKVMTAGHFNGFFGETAEEYLGYMMRSFITNVGELTGWDGAALLKTHGWFPSAEEQKQIALSIGLQSGIFGILGIGGVKHINRVQHNVNTFRRIGDSIHGSDNKIEGNAAKEEAVNRAAASLVAGNGASVQVSAQDLVVYFQERPEVADALGINERQKKKLAERAKEDGVVELSLVDIVTKIKDKSARDLFLDLALSDPSGVKINQVTPEYIASTLIKVSPEELQEKIKELGITLDDDLRYQTSARDFLGSVFDKNDLDYAKFLAGTVRPALRMAGLPAGQRNATLRVFNTMVKNLARKAKMTPMEFLGKLKLDVGTAEEFLAALAKRNSERTQSDVKNALRMRRFSKATRDVEALGDAKVEEQKEKFAAIADVLHKMEIGDRILYGGKELYRVVFQGAEGIVLAGEKGEHVVIPEGMMPLNSDDIVNGLQSGDYTVGKKEAATNGAQNEAANDGQNGLERTENEEDKTAGEEHGDTWEPEDTDNEVDDLGDVPFQGEKLGNQENEGSNGVKLQGEVKDARGAYDPVQNTLHLFEFSDVSTFSHETMHFFLARLRALRESGLLEGSDLLNDLAALEKYATDQEGKYDEEKIAKAWEKYLMTGETKNASLKSAFRALRRWLTDLYQSFKKYFDKVPLTGEVREVFDRWTASDVESDSAVGDNDLVRLALGFGKGNLNSAEREALSDLVFNVKESVFDEVDRVKAKERELVRARALAAAKDFVAHDPDMQKFIFIKTNAPLDRKMLLASYGAEIVRKLGRKGLIAKTPRVARGGEQFSDKQDRRGKEMRRRQLQEAFLEFLRDTYPAAYCCYVQGIKVKPDPRFLVLPEQCGTFLDLKNGYQSDLFITEVCNAELGFSLDEQKVIDELVDFSMRSARSEFFARRREEMEFYENRAVEDFRLHSFDTLEACAVAADYADADEMIRKLLATPTPTEYCRAAVDQALGEFESKFPYQEYASTSNATLQNLDALGKKLLEKTGADERKIDRAVAKKVAAMKLAESDMARALRTDLTQGAISRNARDILVAMQNKEYKKALEHFSTVVALTEFLKCQQELVAAYRSFADACRVTKKTRSMEGDFQYALRLLAADFKIRDRNGVLIENVEALLEKMPRDRNVTLEALLEKSGMALDVDLTKMLPRSGDVKNLSVAEFRDLADFYSAVTKIARGIVSNAKDSRKAVTESVKKDLMDALAQRRDKTQKRNNMTLKEWAATKLQDFRGKTRNFLSFCRELDSWKNIEGRDLGGAFEKNFFNPIMEALTKEHVLKKGVADRIVERRDALLAKLRSMPTKNSDLPALPSDAVKFRYKEWTPDMILCFVLNTGNFVNLQKLCDGFGWTMEERAANVAKIRSCFADKEDWDAIQEIWDAIDSLYQPLDDVFYRENFVHVGREEATPFHVKLADGSTYQLRGGYMPIAYDHKLRFGGRSNRALEVDVAGKTGVSFANGAVADPGSTKERDDRSHGMIDLSLGGVGKHIDDVCHYIAFKELSHRFQALFMHGDFDREMHAKLGEQYTSFKQLLNRLVNPQKPQVHKVLEAGRQMAICAGLWGNLKVGGKQFSSFLNGIEKVGFSYYFDALGEFWAHPVETAKMLHEICPALAARFEGKDLDVRSDLLALPAGTPFKEKAKELKSLGFAYITYCDAAAVYPAFLAMYRRALEEGKSEKDAVDVAYKFTASHQGDGTALMRSIIQDNLFGRFFMMFSGPACAAANQIMDAGSAALEFRDGQHLKFFAQSTISTCLVPALVSALVTLLFDGVLTDPDKRKKYGVSDFLADFGEEAFFNALAAIPGVRDLGYGLKQKSALASVGRSPAAWPLEKGYRVTSDIGNGHIGRAAWTAVEAIAAAYGIPIPTVLNRLDRFFGNNVKKAFGEK